MEFDRPLAPQTFMEIERRTLVLLAQRESESSRITEGVIAGCALDAVRAHEEERRFDMGRRNRFAYVDAMVETHRSRVRASKPLALVQTA